MCLDKVVAGKSLFFTLSPDIDNSEKFFFVSSKYS